MNGGKKKTVDRKQYGAQYREIWAQLQATPEFDIFINKFLELDSENPHGKFYDHDLALRILWDKERLASAMMEKFHLPPHFRYFLHEPLSIGSKELFFVPYRIDPQVVRVEKGNGKPRIAGECLDHLTVTIYGKLSTEDWKSMKERIERLQDICFDPRVLKPFRRSKDLDTKIKIAREMRVRVPKRTHEKLVEGGYIDILTKRGGLSAAEIKTLKKKNPGSVELVSEGKSSADIAAVLGRKSKSKDKGSAIRKAFSRYKHKQKELTS